MSASQAAQPMGPRGAVFAPMHAALAELMQAQAEKVRDALAVAIERMPPALRTVVLRAADQHRVAIADAMDRLLPCLPEADLFALLADPVGACGRLSPAADRALRGVVASQLLERVERDAGLCPTLSAQLAAQVRAALEATRALNARAAGRPVVS